MLYRFFLLFLTLLISPISQASAGEELDIIPVQDGGRIKPFRTFADESLQLVYGKSKYKGKSSTEVVMTWMLIPDHWKDVPIIQVRHNGLREALNLKGEMQIYHSPVEIMSNERLGLLFQELSSRQAKQEKLDPYFQAIQTLQSQLSVFHGIRLGQLLRLVPPAPELKTNTWISLPELDENMKLAFKDLTKSFAARLAAENQENRELDEHLGAEKSYKEAVASFIAKAKAINPALYADQKRIQAEVHLLNFSPFQWAWVIYLIGTLLSIFFLVSGKAFYGRLTVSIIFVAMGFHIYGIALRVYLLGRPPVSNMYETVIWVPLLAMVFALVLNKFKSNKFLLLGAGLINVLCLILSDLSPVVLDSSLQPLQPVLRDNFWLLTHVLIIVTSYAAFFLAFIIGDITLIYFLKGEVKYKQQIKEGVHAIYRSMQIGVVLLALGIILGGVWADYSWGRFWGWDPKETWSLIALLGYIAILHGRIIGWVRDFAMSMLAVLSFSLVIMAWYGVNFVLGAGLHTYGFGAGGVEYVAAFVAIHIIYVSYVATVRHGVMKAAND